jgi:hypothetical protein
MRTHAILVAGDGLVLARTLCGHDRPELRRADGRRLGYFGSADDRCKSCERATLGRRLRRHFGTVRATGTGTGA